MFLLAENLVMPGVNGRELASLICAMRPETIEIDTSDLKGRENEQLAVSWPIACGQIFASAVHILDCHL